MARQIRIKPLAQIQANYEQSGTRAATNYRAGVERNSDWHERATSDEAEQLFAARMQEAIASQRRQGKLREKTSQAEWKSRAMDKGASAIGPAIAKSGAKMADGYAPVRQALEGVTLADKTADWRQNLQNVEKVIEAMKRAVGKE
jgi:hypothetical protein